MTNPLKTHGGKSYLATKIIRLMAPHERYVEPFAGGLAVLLRKAYEGTAEYANDINGELANFWRVLQHQGLFAEFARIVSAIPLSQAEWGSRKNVQPPESSLVTRAVDFFVRLRQSRQGLGRDFCTPTSRLRRTMNENVSAWLSAVDGLPEVHARLRRVEVWNVPAVECIRRLDLPETLYYCDPPYPHATRSSVGEYGAYEMSDADHVELLETLAAIRGKFLLSGYLNPMYDEFAARHGWDRCEIRIDNKASSMKTKETRTEVLWANYRLEAPATGD